MDARVCSFQIIASVTAVKEHDRQAGQLAVSFMLSQSKCRLLAHRVISRQRIISVALGAEADIEAQIYEYTPFCNGPDEVKSPL